MRLIFVNRYFWPDESATSLMLTDLATALAQSGHAVTVLTSRQMLDDPAAALAARAHYQGVQIERLATTRFGRARLLGRAVDYFSFYLSTLWRLLWLAQRGDTIIAKTDPPLLGVAALPAAWIKRARLVNWLQDIYPEVAVRLNLLSARGPLTRMLTVLRNFSLRHAAANVVVGEGMRDFLRARLPQAPLTFLPNWSRELTCTPEPAPDNPYRQELHLTSQVVFGYSGNLGRAHRFDGLIAAATVLGAGAGLHFLIVGQGAQLAFLQAGVRRAGLTNWSFLPYQPRERLDLSLAAADVHLVTLEPALEGLIVPSKLYGILAAARPCIFLGDPAGEVARILTREDCGVTLAPGDATGLARVLRELADDRPRRLRLGTNARRAWEQLYHLPTPAWETLLHSLADH